MNIILGGTGHVASALVEALVAGGEPVTIVSRSDDGARPGVEVAVADVYDVEALRRVFRTGRRAFLLNPPADPSGDSDREERATAAAIVAALDGSGLERVVAQSTYGAQPGEHNGDLGVLHGFEQALARQPIPATALRAAYYMTDWDTALATARDEGAIHTPFPADFKLPMVAPRDLGIAAARLLTAPAASGVHYVEGPEWYSPADVVRAFAAALGRPVEVASVPREGWQDMFRQLGFSEAAAASYARMTAITVDGDYELPDSPERGDTTLEAYIAGLVRTSG